uniref:Uncharacterized protein n=1 Tax=Timema genevievae TaxID=629358 RepID=A0A7R9JZV1_TIMGE|nr:unnamed protein product [Timema genevievae]
MFSDYTGNLKQITQWLHSEWTLVTGSLNLMYALLLLGLCFVPSDIMVTTNNLKKKKKKKKKLVSTRGCERCEEDWTVANEQVATTSSPQKEEGNRKNTKEREEQKEYNRGQSGGKGQSGGNKVAIRWQQSSYKFFWNWVCQTKAVYTETEYLV